MQEISMNEDWEDESIEDIYEEEEDDSMYNPQHHYYDDDDYDDGSGEYDYDNDYGEEY